jgi:hypothetical protein
VKNMAKVERSVEELNKIVNKQSELVVGLTDEGRVLSAKNLAQRMVRNHEAGYATALILAQDKLTEEILKKEKQKKQEAAIELEQLVKAK